MARGELLMEETSKSVQDTFLNHIRTNKTEVTVFLINGVKLQGIVTSFDNFSLLLKKESNLKKQLNFMMEKRKKNKII